MRWDDERNSSWAIAGTCIVGRINATTAPSVAMGSDIRPANSGRAGTIGYAINRTRAKMALVKSWRRYLDERGLVEQEAALGMVREALSKRKA